MLFYTPEFLAFSVVLLLLMVLFRGSSPRKLILLVASYVFYMWWNPAFVLLIVFSTLVDYGIGGRMSRAEDPRRRRLLLSASLIANLGLLGFFKYYGFFSESLLYGMRMLGFQPHWTSLEVILPVGISFYTFQTLSYTIDLYRREIPAATSPLDFALFVAFFPQLVAGPIVRASVFLPQLSRPVRVGWDQTAYFLILRGLAKKVLIADNISYLPDVVFADPSVWPSAIIWIATVSFAVQIYCDFSGYSDIAIGISRILGFELPINFDHPYLARNPSDFWRRWHISLSSWLRDYLYISLGGNRRGRFNTYRNLMLTMLLGGLWHGASWNFVLWGFLHGAILVLHRLYSEWRSRAGAPKAPSSGRASGLLGIAAMQYCVLVSWIAFRVNDFQDMWVAIRKFVFFDFDFALTGIGVGQISLFSTLLLIAAFSALHLASHSVGRADEWLARQGLVTGAVICFLLGGAALALWPLQQAPFIYFQF